MDASVYLGFFCTTCGTRGSGSARCLRCSGCCRSCPCCCHWRALSSRDLPWVRIRCNPCGAGRITCLVPPLITFWQVGRLVGGFTSGRCSPPADPAPAWALVAHGTYHLGAGLQLAWACRGRHAALFHCRWGLSTCCCCCPGWRPTIALRWM